MSKFSKHIILLCLLWIFPVVFMSAQELIPTKELPFNDDDLGDFSDEFQESFFEALKQKAITNHDKAIEEIKKCIEINPNPAILYIELGKNFFKLKKYDQATENLKIASAEKPNDRYLLELLYDTYFAQRKYKEALEVIEKLVKFQSTFKEQLANLYFLEKRYDEALNVIDELIDELGSDSYRKRLRRKITIKLNKPGNQIQKLVQKIKDSPDNEQNYINLIFLYSKNNQEEKALETAEQLLKQKPNSELAHVALYKFYLDKKKNYQML